ncbi:MAG: DUF3098 domain-containing protein [Bacteroidetes bacterium]|nr:DUF3098 domain-containing protein [Bacteroidota bacterium]
MAKSELKKQLSSRKNISLPFTQENFLIFGVGITLIVLGYIALSQSPWDGTLPLVVAPILLVLGYCVIIPFGIIYKKKKQSSSELNPIADQKENH